MDINIVRIKQIIKEAGLIMLEAENIDRRKYLKSGQNNFVTDYDRRVQEYLYKHLIMLMPEAHFVGEEDDLRDNIDHGYAFIIDPIDGTNNFIRGYRQSVISVSLTLDGNVIAGFVYDPYHDVMYEAQLGKGAFLNGEKIMSSSRSLKGGMVMMGTSSYYEELFDDTFEMAKQYMHKGVDIRRTGAAALDLCMVAMGRVELFFELRLQPWDYAAASIIVTEAGGRITDLHNDPIDLKNPCSILARGRGVNEDDVIFI